ncbi:hypothetical protein MYX75_13500, partial [Acidobacteria bacterium AH-259-A15]|nr:hypothetical protein [Acidobacteria bacterium AH-259-A15]
MKRFLRFIACTLLVALVFVPNAFGLNPNPRVAILFGGSFLRGDRSFVVGGNTFTSQFVNGGKVRLRGTLDLTGHWSIE